MGIPTFFRKIISEYPDTHFSWRDLKEVDYFFLDFNSIIYGCIYAVDKKTKPKDFDKELMKKVNEYLQRVICDIVKPQKGVYLAFDGPVPRAKMIQQRYRRFKGIPEKKYIDELKKKHGEPIEFEFDKTKISPGTDFMVKLNKSIISLIKSGGLYKHKKIDITLSDTLVPGEGEHKFMPQIRKLVKDEPESVVVVASPDADVIVLSISTHKNKMYILREVNSQLDGELKGKYDNDGFLYLNIDKTREHFTESLTQEYDGKIDPIRHMVDFVFLTFFVGNDFVVASPYLKVKREGLKIVTTIYKRIFNEEEKYLIDENNGKYTLNLSFFRDLIRELAENEEFNYQKLQKNRDRERKQNGISQNQQKKEENMSEFQIARSRYEHQNYYSRLNPFFKKYNKEFDKINYFNPKDEWKKQYYKYFFHIDDSDSSTIKDISEEYIRCLVWNLGYYFKGIPPSWKYFYPYRAPPVMSDLYAVLSSIKSLKKFSKFDKDESYLPFEQLMLILPPDSSYMLPKDIGNLMKDPNEELIAYYPIDFELEVVLGQKHVYSEPLLPMVDADKVVARVREMYPKLTDAEKKRNVKGKVKKFVVKK